MVDHTVEVPEFASLLARLAVCSALGPRMTEFGRVSPSQRLVVWTCCATPTLGQVELIDMEVLPRI